MFLIHLSSSICDLVLFLPVNFHFQLKSRRYLCALAMTRPRNPVFDLTITEQGNQFILDFFKFKHLVFKYLSSILYT